MNGSFTQNGHQHFSHTGPGEKPYSTTFPHFSRAPKNKLIDEIPGQNTYRATPAVAEDVLYAVKCLFVAAEPSRSAPELAEAAKNLLTRGLPHQSPTTSRYRPVADWRSHVEELVAGVPRRACHDVMTLTYRTSALSVLGGR